tara:strand:- start:28 stop:564 length:537 start_codon:yes stop_codon:yes gene_type:complete
MAGIGDYEKGKAFALKSGNKPTFKVMGSGSPNNLNSFGVGKGTSPYNQEEEKEEGKGKFWKNALKVGVSALTGGLDAVYGKGKIVPLSSDRLKKDDEEVENKTKDEGEKVRDSIITVSNKSSKNMPDANWEKGQEKAKEMGHNMDDLLSKQKSLEKGSDEWKNNQNAINEALGNKKRH